MTCVEHNITVVNIHKGQPCDLYIGRMAKSHLHFGNPFKVGEHGTREECVGMYEEWLRGLSFQTVEPKRRSWILSVLRQLEGKALGCFCAPLVCHGHILIKLWEESFGNTTN